MTKTLLKKLVSPDIVLIINKSHKNNPTTISPSIKTRHTFLVFSNEDLMSDSKLICSFDCGIVFVQGYEGNTSVWLTDVFLSNSGSDQ